MAFSSFFFSFFFLPLSRFDSVDRVGLVLILFTGRLIKVVYSLLKKVGRYYDLIGCVLFGLLVWTMIDFHFSHFNNRESILINVCIIVLSALKKKINLSRSNNIFKLICYLFQKYYYKFFSTDCSNISCTTHCENLSLNRREDFSLEPIDN